MSKAATLILCLTIYCGLTWGQNITASLQGVVRDSSGGVIPNAQIRITNAGTNTTAVLVSGDDGRYVAPSLPAGQYSVSAEATGFKTFQQTGIVLEVDQSAKLDLVLEVGSITEVIKISGQAPLLESTSAAIGQVIDNKSIVNLPLNQRNPFSLVLLVPGVTGAPGAQFNNVNFSANGGRPGANEILLDGIPSSPPAVQPISVFTIFPSVDAVEEFKVQTNNYSAEFGRSGGAVVNLIYKSGTNEFHGTGFEFIRNSVLDANSFFNNKNGIHLASFRRNQFGGSLGGPVVIPKLYNGHNKTFFFADYEGLRQGSASNILDNVPTPEQRAGNFSQLKTSTGAPVIIYDPSTTVQNGATYVRSPFPGNIIPPNRFDPVARNVVKYFPLPNLPGDPFTHTNNYASAGTDVNNIDQYDVKVDENINETNRFFTRFSRRKLDIIPATQFPAEIAIAQPLFFQPQIGTGAAFDYTWVARPTFLLDFRYGFGRTLLNFKPKSLGFDPTQLGFPTYIRDGADQLEFPEFAPAGYIQLGDNGSDYRRNSFETHSFVLGATSVFTTHVVKFGAETRILRVNNTEAGAEDGNFTFARQLTQGPDPNKATVTGGDSFASFLLGLGSGTLSKNFKGVSTLSHYYGFYVQDDWKPTSKLTLNMGLRYELQQPRTERYDRMNYFDPNVASPLAGPSGLANLKGGLVFVGVNGASRQQFTTKLKNFAPRFGFAYQIKPKTVIRSAFGIFYAPSPSEAGGSVGNFGYRSDTQFVGSADGLTPFSYLSNPFPSGITPIPGNSQGLVSQIGSPIQAPLPSTTVPYTEGWSFNLQRELPRGILVEAGYVGNHGVHLTDGGEGDYNLNQLTSQQLALGQQALQQQVSNPFYGIITTGALSAKTIPYNFLLRRFPQFPTVGLLFPTNGSSTYHSLQVKAEKRLSAGVSFLVAYTKAKQIDDFSIIANAGRNAAHQDIYNDRGDRSVSANDVSQRLVVSTIYEIPFFRKRAIIGGWQLNAIASFQTGFPLNITTTNTANAGNQSLRPNNNGQSAKLDNPTIGRWFDTSVFTQPLPYTFGNTGRTLPDVRGPGVKNIDFSLFKNFSVREYLKVQFRAEAFNLTNTVQFGLPNQSLNSNQFGVITGQANSPRQVQFGLKLIF